MNDASAPLTIRFPLRADLARGKEIVETWFNAIEGEWGTNSSDVEDRELLKRLIDQIEPRD